MIAAREVAQESPWRSFLYAKPDPDLFPAAAERLGVNIVHSVVVGDSIWDLLAARRAHALGVGPLLHLDKVGVHGAF